MIDLGISKMALIGAVALIVIGPEKLPRVARTVGTLLGKAQRYVNDVKAEVNRSMELDELRKMKDTVAGAARDVEQSVRTHASDFERDIHGTGGADAASPAATGGDAATDPYGGYHSIYGGLSADQPPVYRRPDKKWRVKQGATPQWYKARHGVRTKALSGAARVARYRPRRPD